MNELSTTIEITRSNYATKEELATLSGKVDVLASNLQAFHATPMLAVTKFSPPCFPIELDWGYNDNLLACSCTPLPRTL